jgi:hypothetical protein
LKLNYREASPLKITKASSKRTSSLLRAHPNVSISQDQWLSSDEEEALVNTVPAEMYKTLETVIKKLQTSLSTKESLLAEKEEAIEVRRS